MQKPRAKGWYAQVKAFYALHLRGFSMMPHAHAQREVMYVVSGECVIEIGGEALRLKEREFVYINSDVPHSLVLDAGCPCGVLNIEFALHSTPPGIDISWEVEQSRNLEGFLQSEKPFMKMSDNRKVGYALKDLIEELETGNTRQESDELLIRLLLCRLLAELANSTLQDTRHAGAIHMNRAVQFIGQHLFEPLDVAAVAGHVGINSAYLQTLFARQYQCGIIAYVNRQRMEYASFLLKNSDKSVFDIAFEVGYNSRQHFNYVFNKQFGSSPRQYRALSSHAVQAHTGHDYRLEDTGENYIRGTLRE